MKRYRFLVFYFLISIVSIHCSHSQIARNNQVKNSIGINKTQYLDEFDNYILYNGSSFHPFAFYARFANESWRHQLNFNRLNYKLTPFLDAAGYDHNFVAYRSTEFRYDLLKKISLTKNADFRFFSGIGIHSFGSTRERKTQYTKYPYENVVISYDINAASLQVVLNPEYEKGRHLFSSYASTGIFHLVTRPAGYNPLFNDGEWRLSSFSDHLNFRWMLSYSFSVSERILLGLDYSYFFYKYTFPSTLKMLNQSYMAGVTFKY
jgi:hypothetical protein